MTSHSEPTAIDVMPAATDSVNPLRTFVEIKFTKLGLPFAFGVVTMQDDAVYWTYGARESGCVDKYELGDTFLSALAELDAPLSNREELTRTLRNYLRNVEREDFKLSIARGIDHADAAKLRLYGSRLTLVYLQTLIPDAMADFRFMSLDGVDHAMQKRMSSDHGLRHFPHSPVTWAHTAALAVLKLEASS